MSRSYKRPPAPHEAKRFENGCAHKVGFPSQAKAIGRAKALVQAGTFEGMTVYHCPFCHRRHLSGKVEK